jgi:hypothetical protein
VLGAGMGEEGRGHGHIQVSDNNRNFAGLIGFTISV